MAYTNNSFLGTASTLPAAKYLNVSEHMEEEFPDEQPPVSVMTEGCYLYTFIIYTVVVGILCIAGLVGNLTSFVVFQRDKIKNSTTFLLQALSLIDASLLLLAIPVYPINTMATYTGKFETYMNLVNPWVMVYIVPLLLLTQTATIWTTILIGASRYIAVCKPLHARRLCTVAKARKQLLIVLAVAVLYNTPHFCEGRVVREIQVTPTGNFTIFEPRYTSLGNNYYYRIIYGNICYLICMLTVPILVLSVISVRLLQALKAQQHERVEMRMHQQNNNSITFLLIVVILIFIISQTPAMVNQILWNVLSYEYRQCEGLQFYFQRISNVLVISNSAVNLLIYIRFNKRFRRILVNMVCNKWRSRPNAKRNSTWWERREMRISQTLVHIMFCRLYGTKYIFARIWFENVVCKRAVIFTRHQSINSPSVAVLRGVIAYCCRNTKTFRKPRGSHL